MEVIQEGEYVMQSHFQNKQMQEVLKFLETSPYKYIISSFTGGAFHVKFYIPWEINKEEELKEQTEPPAKSLE